ncbi:MAG: LemA family protein [Defluviitaleaceae bacterium]|nr:LemA family protein [Defluviitaleaceae bacterium]
MDKALAVLDVLLRARLEILYDTQPDEVREMCADFATLETRNLLQSVVQIKIEPLDEILRENIAETDVAAVEYNEAAAVYNAYIAKFPAKIMAILLGMTQEKDI